jgi:hypothetical protein
VNAAAVSQASSPGPGRGAGATDRQPTFVPRASGSILRQGRLSWKPFEWRTIWDIWSSAISLGRGRLRRRRAATPRVIRGRVGDGQQSGAQTIEHRGGIPLNRRRCARLIPAKVQVTDHRVAQPHGFDGEVTAGNGGEKGGDPLRGGLQYGLAADRVSGGEATPAAR